MTFSDQNYLLFTFSIYLLLMLGIGIFAWTKTNDLSDYILGGRKLGHWTTALSAGASDMSGWLCCLACQVMPMSQDMKQYGLLLVYF